MNTVKKYLKQNVQLEPLVNQWHAYPFLIAPSTAAMVTTNYQLSIMKSYIQMPMAHVAALKNPEMIGGPFIDYNGKRVNEIKELKSQIESRSRNLVDFAKGIKELSELLQNKAKGYPLEAIYKEMPETVKGFVEIMYDLNNQPSFRFIEGLLYKSDYYNQELQSIALTLINSDDRPFVFSTPRLKDNTIVHLDIPFSDARIDALSKLKEEPKTYTEIKALLGIKDEEDELFQSFLTVEAPVRQPKYDEQQVRVRYFGHACVLLQTADVAILTDPLISYKYESDIERYTYADLPDTIDYVVITHTHHDHIVLETLLQLRRKIRHIIVPKSNGSLQDPSMKQILKNIGFSSVIELDEMETLQLKGVEITGVPFFGEHCDLNIRSKLSYFINFPAQRFLMCADSSSLNPAVYENVQKVIGNVDVLFVGMECTGAPMSWAYGALFPNSIDRQLDQQRRSNGSDCEKGLQLVDIFSIKQAYLYAMGAEPWLNYFMALQHSHSENTSDETGSFLKGCKEREVDAESLFASKELIFSQTLESTI